MADKQELIERLQAVIRELTTSERWERWLRMQRRFHRYSWGNVFLIGLQRPEATQVAGFHTWKAMRRSVRKGEKGIAIIAPVVRRTRVEDEDGNVSVVPGSPAAFRLAYVFDVAQTDGEELATAPVSRLCGDDPGNVYEGLVSTAAAIGYTVELAEFTSPDKNGDCRFEPRIIRIRDCLAPAQACKTLAHELAHALLHGGHVCADIRSVGSWRPRAWPTSSAPSSRSTARRTASGTSQRGPAAARRRPSESPNRRSGSRRPGGGSSPAGLTPT